MTLVVYQCLQFWIMYQLPPVKLCPIFKHPDLLTRWYGTIAMAWFSAAWELTDVLGQNDKAFVDMSNGMHTKQPGWFSWDCNVMSPQTNTWWRHPLYPIHAMHVYTYNWFARRNNKMLHDLWNEIFSLIGIDSKKMAIVVLIINVGVSDGVTNGAVGTVSNTVLQSNWSGTRDCIEAILVSLDSPENVGNAIWTTNYKCLTDSAVLITKQHATSPVHGRIHVTTSKNCTSFATTDSN